jgi:hypothetical protein|tara:strand:- start:60 stop:1325 length:1266 start_codon:yes stop_codon:yes gene_type:complete
MSKQPKQIKELIIPPNMPEINSLDAIMYVITCLDTGKWYRGIHKLGDRIYWHTSKNKEFNKKWVDKNSRFRYEYEEWGTYPFMTLREHQELKIVDAKNNPMSWNGSNGSPRTKALPDIDKIDRILNKIKKREYLIRKMNRKDVENIEFLQTRMQQFLRNKITNISLAIDKALSTDKCDPLVLFDDYYGTGKHIGIGGNHTRRAYLQSKHGKYGSIGVVLIPRKDYEDLTEDEMKALGHALNPKEEVEKDPTSVDDQIKYLYEMIESGKELWDSNTNRWHKPIKRYLEDTLKFKDNDIKKVKKGIKNLILNEKMKNKGGLVFKNYDIDGPHFHELADTKKRYEAEGVTSIVGKSSSVTLDRIIAKANGNDTIVVSVHHIDPINELKWPGIQKRIQEGWDYFDNDDKNIIFYEMECWVPDRSK